MTGIESREGVHRLGVHMIVMGEARRITMSDDDLTAIRTYLQQQRALGKDDFRDMVEAKTRRFAGVRPAHRPPAQQINTGK